MGIMGPGDFLSIHPTELKFPFELKKQSSCCIQLTNKTDQYVAFKVKTTNPAKYSVRPNAGVILPGSVSNVAVGMQAHKEMPTEMQCKDKFLIQSVVVPDGTTVKDISHQMFNKEEGKVVGELRLRVAYIPANPPSPVPEEAEEDFLATSSNMEDEVKKASLSKAAERSLEEPTARSSSSEAWSMISKLMDDKALVVQQNQKLCQELDKMRKQTHGKRLTGFSIMFVVLVGLLGILLGYFI